MLSQSHTMLPSAPRYIYAQVARELNLEGIVREGVYCMVGGPNYETVAELKLLRELGVDSVGEFK